MKMGADGDLGINGLQYGESGYHSSDSEDETALHASHNVGGGYHFNKSGGAASASVDDSFERMLKAGMSPKKKKKKAGV